MTDKRQTEELNERELNQVTGGNMEAWPTSVTGKTGAENGEDRFSASGTGNIKKPGEKGYSVSGATDGS